ncbi:MAG: Mth938-like domain-containing protein [Pseudomonadota bacterium]
MKFDFVQNSGFIINAYQPGEIRVNGMRYQHSVIVTPKTCMQWQIERIEELQAEHLAIIQQQKPDILLLGTGERQQFPPTEHYAGLLSAGIGVEIMHSAAAARTFNLLLDEERDVMAAIIV